MATAADRTQRLGDRATGRVPAHHQIAFLVMAGLFAVAPLVLYPIFLMKVLCFALFATAFNLLIGYVGLLSFGHAAFFGSAAYVAAHAAKVWGWPTELALLAATVAAAGLGFVIGGLAIRRHGIYFAMVTLALAQMVFFFALQAPFTGGEDGIQATNAPIMYWAPWVKLMMLSMPKMTAKPRLSMA